MVGGPLGGQGAGGHQVSEVRTRGLPCGRTARHHHHNLAPWLGLSHSLLFWGGGPRVASFVGQFFFFYFLSLRSCVMGLSCLSGQSEIFMSPG